MKELNKSQTVQVVKLLNSFMNEDNRDYRSVGIRLNGAYDTSESPLGSLTRSIKNIREAVNRFDCFLTRILEGDDSAWPAEYDQNSKLQGWELAEDGNTFKLQVLDDPKATLKEFQVAGLFEDIANIPKLEDDRVAVAHCFQQAMKGSRMHALALYLNGMSTDTDVKSIPSNLLLGVQI